MQKKLSEIGKVLNGGYCVGCGTCSAASGKFNMRLNKYGALVPNVSADSKDLSSVSSVCPFSADGPDEDVIGKELYGKDEFHHSALGHFCATYAGYVSEDNYRDKGSSGGMGSWILIEMLKKNLVDKVLHVHAVDPDKNDGRLFSYYISADENEVCKGGKSRYYPVSMDEVLRYVMNNPGRYVISGVPCFIKAVRRLAIINPVIKKRIVYTLGLICGHLKTTGFGESLAWQAGVVPSNVKTLDFRHKLDMQHSASKYGFMVRPKTGEKDVVRSMSKLLGRDWGMGFFKLKACEFCDDVTAETADISIGDAWLPEYLTDTRGTNVIIVRNITLNDMIKNEIEGPRLNIEPLSPVRVVLSQDAGLRHRREGLSYRLWLKDKKDEWRPHKRIWPNRNLSIHRKLVLILRYQLMKKSITAFYEAKEQDNISVFIRGVGFKVKIYRMVNFLIRVVNKVSNISKKIKR